MLMEDVQEVKIDNVEIMNEAKVAIVIVCMNNMKNLVTCLDSIAKYTKIEHEVWVNAYMFSDENLKIAQEKYPYVHWVINNEIAGFAENNNMILRQIKTEYVLVLNDDTEFKEPVLDKLMETITQHEEISILSPVLYLADGSVQFCGRNPITIWDFIMIDTSLADTAKRPSKYINQKGLFQTYNISGACFLIRMSDFRELGLFDEYYFFSPEDTALSTLANKKGYQCWVDTNVGVTHYFGKTRKSKVKQAVLPALRAGCIKFYSEGLLWKSLLLKTIIIIQSTLKTFYFFVKGDIIEYHAQKNCVATIFSKMTPKEIFVYYYNQINQNEK